MQTLKQAYQDYFQLGNIYTPKEAKSPKGSAIAEHFHIITPENIMKPALMQPKKGEYLFQLADDMFTYAKENNLTVAGHTLVWHQQSLNWLEDHAKTREEAIQYMRAHMEQVITRYAGQIAAWDVVNEAIKDDIRSDTSDWRAHLRDSKWLRLIGPDYIQIAFEMAHEIDPSATLYYNDYNLNYTNKAEVTYHMVRELRAAGVPIHGIGMQGHYHTNTPLETVENSLNLFAQIPGIKISFTELDITVTGSEGKSALTDAQNRLQAQKYAQLFQLFKANASLIERITFWGYDDASSWRSDRFPNLWNADLTPKPAFYAVLNPEKYLAENPLEAPTGPKQAKLGEPFNIDMQTTAWEGATATAKAHLQGDSLTIIAHVHSKNVHPNDSVTLYLDLLGNKSATYEADDHMFTVTSENRLTTHTKTPDALKTSATLTDTGYEITASFQVPTTTQKIGLELQVNDHDEHGHIQSVAKWNDGTGDTYRSTANFGELTLI